MMRIIKKTDKRKHCPNHMVTQYEDNVEDECTDESYKVAGIPPWERFVLTITEAACYYHIGESKLRNMIIEYPNNEFTIMNGNRVLIKKKQFELFLDMASAI